MDSSPVPSLRDAIRRRQRTKRGRHESEDRIRAIDAGVLDRIVASALAEGTSAGVFVLLQLDAGLRVGEALGLRWGRIDWGDDEDDPSRHLIIDTTRSRGGAPEPPKSGRVRRLALSRRLRQALQALYSELWEPSPEAFVLEGTWPENFSKREWRRILKAAGCPHHAMKDLRDTFASQLLTCGVSLGWVSHALGHSGVDVTAKHYARWLDGAEYRQPFQLEPGEVPPDFLARLGDGPTRPIAAQTEGEEQGPEARERSQHLTTPLCPSWERGDT